MKMDTQLKSDKRKIKNTLGMFDQAKGVVMLFVMLAHTYGLYDYANAHAAEFGRFTAIALRFLMVFGEALMPVFFIINGYGYRKTTLKKCVKKQGELLLFPYFVTSVVTLIIYGTSNFLETGYVKASIIVTLRRMIGFLFGYSIDKRIFGYTYLWCGPIWFLLAAFVGNVIFNELLNKFSGWKLLMASFLAACIGWGLSFIYLMPWCISQGFVASLYICMGYLAKKEKIFTERISGGFKTIAIILLITIIALNIRGFGGGNMADGVYALGPVTIASGGLFGMVVIYIFLRMNRFNGRISAYIRTIGRYSLYVLCIHNIEFMTFGGRIQMAFVNSYKGNSVFVRSLIIFAIRTVIVTTAVLMYVWAKNKCMSRNQKV